jgi:branched-chain amino acid transport system ATP-binding protein
VIGAAMSGDAILGETVLSAADVGMRFDGFRALANVTLDIRKGDLTAIIGPNGAGKSTFFNILSGAFPPSEGRIVFEGRDITGRRQHEFARLGIAKSFQITNVFPQLTAAENVRIAAQAMKIRYDIWTPRRQLTEFVAKAAELLNLVGLHRNRERRAENLAHGEQRALEIAMALASDPRLLLLDEPTAGMSPEETMMMMNLITKLAEDRTVVLVEHKMKLVMGISDRIVVLHHGELLADGAPGDIRANDEVRRVYLGQPG